MIHPSRRWRFITQLEDRGYCEDEVVQHNVTELRALRRSFSEKFTQDAVAAEEVRKQTVIASRCNPPALPRIYAMEMVEGYLTLVMELVQGVALETLVEKKRYSKPKDWVEFAITLVNELIELQNQEVKFERLNYSHLVVTDSHEIRINTRQPVGRLDSELLTQSKFLKRFEIKNQGGVYTAPGKPDELEELWAIREILAKAACSNVRNSYEQLVQEAERHPERYAGSPLAMVEKATADLLIDISVTPGDGKAITNLDKLMMRLTAFEKEANKPKTMEQTAWGAAAAASAEVSNKQSSSQYTPPPVGIPPTPAATEDDRIPGLKESTRSPVNAEGSGGPRVSATETRELERVDFWDPDEDVNPYASDAKKEASKSAPPPVRPAPSSEAVRLPSSSSNPAIPAMIGAKPKAGGMDGKNLVTIAIAGVVILGIGAAAFFGIKSLMNRKGPNHPPVAALKPLAKTTVTINERLELDASASVDEDKDVLSYYWEFVSPESGSVIFSSQNPSRIEEKKNFAVQVPKITVQFMSVGENTLRLVVRDQESVSESVTIKVNVLGR